MTDTVTLIGIDCATVPERTGLARGTLRGGELELCEARLGPRKGDLAERLAGWVDGPTLLALDAPLGWPEPLGRALADHVAGAPLHGEAEALFGRLTDRRVREVLGKRPLEVGAERIARTARVALALLDDVRRRTGGNLGLWWGGGVERASAVEVYSAAVLLARGWHRPGYRASGAEARAAREAIVDDLATELLLACEREELARSVDVLDAALCVLAAADCVRGHALAPRTEELPRARREGWIWFRPPGEDATART